MIRRPPWALLGLSLFTLVAGRAFGAERLFDFSSQIGGDRPLGFTPALTGKGEPGDWQIKEVSLDSAGQSSISAREAVIAQLARDPTDEHFPLLIYKEAVFSDFTLSAKVKAVEGDVEQMGGLAFRLVDSTNYYILRLSALGNTVRFYKVVEGVRSAPIGVTGPVAADVWHELKVQCQGNQIRCWFNGQELFPVLTDNTFTRGSIALWTKSDSVSYFKDLRIEYTPTEILAKRLVREGMERARRLLGLELYAAQPGSEEVRLLASSDPQAEGKLAGTVEEDVARQGTLYYGKDRKSVSVVMPIRDRNGDPVAAVRVTMKTFPGQTQNNALARAKPVVDRMAKQVRSQRDLFR
jgi:hypothetical protein